MGTSLLRNPLIVFLFVSIVLTQISVAFPQSLGNFHKVSGWPLTIYKVDYRMAGDIEPTGKFVHWLAPTNSRMMWEKFILNILIWTTLLQGTWWFYKKLEEPTANQTSE